MRSDGDAWVTCELGHPHWGRHGAAGLLLRTRSAHATDRLVLVQLRVSWSHHGGTWGLLGGARDSHESAVDTALREAVEEGGIDPTMVRVTSASPDDHGGWSYTTVVAETDDAFPVAPANAESDELRWVPDAEVTNLPLHPHFALSWPSLQTMPTAPLLVVDAANVVGSKPDGWWRDRIGAARRLRDRLGGIVSRGLRTDQLTFLDLPKPAPQSWFAELYFVVEGAAKPLADEPDPTGVRTLAADRSGDDLIVELVAEQAADGDRPTVVVTADRELRRRCAHAGGRAVAVGPGWLHEVLDAS